MMRSIVISAGLVLCVGACDSDVDVNVTINSSAETTAKMAFDALVDSHWEDSLRENPVMASGQGDRRYNDKLRGVTPTDHARRADQAERFLAELRSIDRNALPAGDQLNYDMLDFILRHQVALAPYKAWRVPLLSDAGFHFEAARIARTHLFENAGDYDAYIARLQAVETFFADNIANMRAGIADGVTMPAAILPGVITVIEGQQWDRAESTPFWHPFMRKPVYIDDDAWADLQAQGRDVIANSVMPQYAAFLAFMRDEYQPAARATIGASALPDGEAHYDALIEYFTNLDLTADDVHALGLSEVTRIRAEMDAIIEKVDFSGSFADFIDFLRTDPRFYARSPRELLSAASYWAKKADGQLPAFFGKLPSQPYSVQPVPAAIAPNYTAGRYSGAPLDAKRGGEYWVNTYNLPARPLYALPALTLHESVPGHHLQSALALELEDVPHFRLNFYPHAFGEGWGLYSEKLGLEMGFYDDPYDDFGRLTYEMWRACRLVVDTGMHAKGWSRQQALDYLAGNTALSIHEVTTEIDRYIAWPGQALAYKMGELKILELRAKAEAALGADFDIRTFHDAVIAEGGIPLGLLERQIDAYIAQEQK